MNGKIKAGTGATVADFQNHLIAGSNQRDFNFDFKKRFKARQCFKCQSDYMKFSVEGVCQSCLQRIEFIIRERPPIRRSNRQEGGAK